MIYTARYPGAEVFEVPGFAVKSGNNSIKMIGVEMLG